MSSVLSMDPYGARDKNTHSNIIMCYTITQKARPLGKIPAGAHAN